ncbi:hypothetical protein ACHAXN_011218 [Cyclotella atomus]
MDMDESTHSPIAGGIPSAPSLDVMGEIITEIKSGCQEVKTSSSVNTSEKEYIMALNSLVNSPDGCNASVAGYSENRRRQNTEPQDNIITGGGQGAAASGGASENAEGSRKSSVDKTPEEGINGSAIGDIAPTAVKINPAAATSDTSKLSKDMSPFHIGGPNTCLPFSLESFLGWSLCVSCLSVSGYHYAKSLLLSSNLYNKMRRFMHGCIVSTMKRWLGCPGGQLTSGFDAHNFTEQGQWIPLTTCTRDELKRHSPWESYLMLVRILEKEYPETLVPLLAIENDSAKLDGVKTTTSQTCADEVVSNKECYIALTQQADAALIRVLRRDGVCRRLASLAMRPHKVLINVTTTMTSKTVATINPSAVNSEAEIHTVSLPTYTTIKTRHWKTTSTLLKQLPHNHLLQRLSNIWHDLLVLPSLEESKTFYRIPTTDPPTAQKNYLTNDAHYAFKISLILPAYQEKGSHVKLKLNKALEMACSPENVEVIVVDAGGCTNLEMVLEEPGQSKHWGRICIVTYTSGGGRGPCLNYGADSATGRILTFCHSDTLLPLRWDNRILKTLEHDNKDDSDLKRMGIARVNSCSFLFGIDKSPEGLSMPFSTSLKQYFPPGLCAVETTANLRSYLYSLPYGDSTLSLHAAVFHFLGGYPSQCLMEDYELVSLLRLRSALFSQTPDSNREKLAMIRGQPALCSPRRWQKFGVLYVTYMNSRFVNLYAGAMQIGADDLFKMYYGAEPPKRETYLSPWEVELECRLSGKN